jgi:hypothetical protein
VDPKALADVRHIATREGYCFHHVQAIMVAIDQCAETALGNRDFFPEQTAWHWWSQER